MFSRKFIVCVAVLAFVSCVQGMNSTKLQQSPQVSTAALHQAARRGDCHIIKTLIDRGADLTGVIDGESALDAAVRANTLLSLKVLLQLLKQGRRSLLNKSVQEAVLKRALVTALSMKNQEAACYILTNMTNYYGINGYGSLLKEAFLQAVVQGFFPLIPLFLVQDVTLNNTYIDRALKQKHVDAVRSLISWGTNYKTTQLEQLLLFFTNLLDRALLENNYQQLSSLITENPGRGTYSFELFLRAIHRGELENVLVLLDANPPTELQAFNACKRVEFVLELLNKQKRAATDVKQTYQALLVKLQKISLDLHFDKKFPGVTSSNKAIVRLLLQHGAHCDWTYGQICNQPRVLTASSNNSDTSFNPTAFLENVTQGNVASVESVLNRAKPGFEFVYKAYKIVRNTNTDSYQEIKKLLELYAENHTMQLRWSIKDL